MYGVELLSASDSVDHAMATPEKESMQHLGPTGECWIIGEIVDNDRYLTHMFLSSVVHEVGDSYAEYPGSREGRQGHSGRSRSDPCLYVGPSSLS